ncbi:MAG: 30S ribosomal protein S2 [Patescibacteria group bacterium]|nr:30S ribosomal protein S2 [Patescibacteria group bacterium]
MAENKEEKKIKKEIDFKIDVEEMARAGLHFGHRTSRVNPKMEPYLYGVRNTIHIIDLEKTKEKLEEALKFIQELIAENKILLLVGTKIQVKDLIKEIAAECGLPYVNERWLGGTFTNFETIKKRIEYFKDLEKKKKEGELEKYTKKERAKIDKELRDLEIKFGGIKDLEKLPDAIFVSDMKKDHLAVKEARQKGIKVIGISDTNVDPTLADYPIPANDDAISSVKYILEKVKEVIKNQKLKVKS